MCICAICRLHVYSTLRLSSVLNRDYTILQSITEAAPVANLSSCSDILFESQSASPCLCHYDVCVGWYPCGLKYCRGKDSAGRIVSYRCGIKTCSRCRRFEFRVQSKSSCVWDEPEFQLQSELDSAPGDDGGEGANSPANDDNEDNAISNNSPLKADGEVRQPAEGDVVRESGGVDLQHNDGSITAIRMSQKSERGEPSVVPASRITEVSNTRQNIKVASSSPQNILDDDEDGE